MKCIAVWPSFCENSEMTVCACELSPCFCFASVLSQLEKVGGLKGASFFSLMGVAFAISVAVGVLTDRAVGMCLVGERNHGKDGDVCIHGFQSEIY